MDESDDEEMEGKEDTSTFIFEDEYRSDNGERRKIDEYFYLRNAQYHVDGKYIELDEEMVILGVTLDRKCTTNAYLKNVAHRMNIVKFNCIKLMDKYNVNMGSVKLFVDQSSLSLLNYCG
eukprot:832164_1